MKHFNWMVIGDIDKQGIWFYGTKNQQWYVIYWNPIKHIKNMKNGWSFGLFPFLKKHIKWD